MNDFKKRWLKVERFYFMHKHWLWLGLFIFFFFIFPFLTTEDIDFDAISSHIP